MAARHGGEQPADLTHLQILFAHDQDLIHVSGRLLLLHHFSEEFSVGEPTGISGHKQQVARFDKRLMFPWLSKSIRDSETHLPG